MPLFMSATVAHKAHRPPQGSHDLLHMLLQVVGRLAEQISQLLQGKDKPTYNPRKEQGDVVIVTNAAHVHLTHDKWNTKLYRWHTGGVLRDQA
jgi:ribosomal protein L13